MKNIKKYSNNTQTSRNLENAIADEALCHVKYTVWGDEAEKMGYPQIAHCYRMAANNELAHARLWMEELGMNRSINENLQNAVSCEKTGNSNYTLYAGVAEDEGFNELRDKFLNAAQVENNHMENFSRIHNRFVDEEMFVSKDCNAMWRCYNCGYLAQSETPPSGCPLCGRPETWFVGE